MAPSDTPKWSDNSRNNETWWVNHKQTFAQEVEGNYIWSPTAKSNGERNKFYDNMKRVKAPCRRLLRATPPREDGCLLDD